MTFCAFCSEPVDPATAYRKVTGWERRSPDPSRRGGSDIALREPDGHVLAHASCIDRIRNGVDVRQESLL